MEKFKKELEILINKHSIENGSNTPDFILAEYLTLCLTIFNKTILAKENHNNNKETKEKINIKNIVNDINYHNNCAKATLGKIPILTEEEYFKSLEKTNNFKNNINVDIIDSLNINDVDEVFLEFELSNNVVHINKYNDGDIGIKLDNNNPVYLNSKQIVFLINWINNSLFNNENNLVCKECKTNKPMEGTDTCQWCALSDI